MGPRRELPGRPAGLGRSRCANRRRHRAIRATQALAAQRRSLAARLSRARGRLEELWSEQRTELPFDAATVDEALAALRSRFGNARIEHRLAQIATDGSQKLGPRIIDPLRSRLSAGRDPGRAQLGVLAAWADHLAGPDVRDAGAGALVERLRDATAPRERAAAVLRALAPDLTDLTDPLAERIAARQQGALA